MYLNYYQYFKKKKTFPLILLIFFSILVRIPIILIYGDHSLENEWKILVDNLIIHGKLSFRSFDDFLLPNLYMPPLYAIYLYLFSIFNLEEQSYIKLILMSQVFLSSISVAIFYKINEIFFSKKISFYSSLFFSFFPLHLYACGQISSITLQIFFTILFFYYLYELIEKKNFFSILILSFAGGLLILLRGEFFVILLFSLIYSFIYFKVSIKKILLILIITFITISPYLVRNILIFKTPTITKSFGYNLWKGNNPNSNVEGAEFINNKIQKKIDEIPKDKFYGINYDKIFFDLAITNISKEPINYIILFLKKVASFLFIDIKSSHPNYYNPLHYVPLLLVGITSLIGIILSDKNSHKFNYLILIFFINIIIFSTFFILPRYKLIILPFQIIFTNVLLEYIKNKFFTHHE